MDALLKPGQTLESRFQLLEEIGRGGMAIVFKALDMADGGRLVAIKVPRPLYASGLGSWSMFQREAEIGAQLDHPSILRFVDLDAKHKKARSYTVTEYVPGPTLASRIGAGPRMDEGEAVRLAARICEAIEYLHARGFVHYDLKPGNVILAEDGSIRVIDLGMAHDIAFGRSWLGQAPPVATSQYVAPEQIDRRRGQASVDIYALGAMLYEMLTGEPPFAGDDPFVIASARQISDPVAPRVHRPELSEQVEEVVLRALRRRPSERYATVAALRADLENVGAVKVSGLARRLVPLTRARRWLRIARFVALTAMVPLASMAGLFCLLWWWLARHH